MTDTCMHWHVTYEYTDDTVTRTCTGCGALGTLPRCQCPRKKGDLQCKGYMIDGVCRWHPDGVVPTKVIKPRVIKPTTLICKAKRKNGTPCTANAVRATGRCIFHGGAK
jgi:hypothetical protein